MKVYFLKQKALDTLEKDIAENIEKYQGTEQWAESYFISKDMPNYYFDTEIEVPDYQLIIGGPEADDAQEEEQGKEKKTSANKILDRIGYRYFFKASRGKVFVRQGISRLFWSAYLTYDADNENPYEYTEYFFSKQDIFTSITERSYARNKILVLAALKDLKAHLELGRTEIRLFLAKLNQAGAIKVLDFLDKGQAEELCAEVMTEVVNVKALQEGSKFRTFDNLTGKKFGPNLSIIDGKVVAAGKVINTKPQNLLGKKECSLL